MKGAEIFTRQLGVPRNESREGDKARREEKNSLS